ncbi:hypothetical protein FQN54_003171 [Arachnomyces sp. PD_36]|nr:hypothetical protein FQN54_003171 [Arachnomyces sp. PD_36]
MLRRKPTAITITSEDIASFEESRLQKQLQAQQKLQQQEQRQQQQNNSQDASSTPTNTNVASNTAAANMFDPNDELKPLPGDKARIVRTRDERIGIGRAG